MQISTIGLDIAKNVFQVHAVDVAGQVVVRRQLRRSEMLKFFRKLAPCRVGMEACGTAHYWGRELAALGHDVRLLPASRVKPYVKPGKKNDAADAAAILEAMDRPGMTHVPVKSVEQQAVLMLHRSRDLLVRHRTMLINAIRAHLSEMGFVARQGQGGSKELLALLDEAGDERVPALVRAALLPLAGQLCEAEARITAYEAEIVAWHKGNAASLRLADIPGIGPITATAIAASIGDPKRFASGRQFAAWLGLVPRQNSSGGKDRLGAITKMGDPYIRRLLVLGATGTIRYARNTTGKSAWLDVLLSRKPARLAAVALANKRARIAWALLAHGTIYSQTQPAAA
ncbi:MAG: IS110 family transposase [Rhodospirillales bacterium]|nr:IS110 family transposase [Rhodospirillales bacterium]